MINILFFNLPDISFRLPVFPTLLVLKKPEAVFKTNFRFYYPSVIVSSFSSGLPDFPSSGLPD